ncbi:MAG: Glu-tRNA(Gln) amidotransferase subunit GatE [Candidatus Woesearchaeota archaeon]
MNYEELGFRCGLEIHSQLEGKKLFCSCKTEIVDGKPDIIFRRKLRTTAGEAGEIDIAAAAEMAKGKYFVYHFYDKSNCLVDMDEEPPHPVNQEALKIAITVANLMHMKVVDEIQFMRKIVIDGSNVSGFQRTALVARDGYIETSKGKVSIQTLCLEEEAAKTVERTKEYDVYNISRLGIPLLEIATGSEIKDPEHAKETAEKIGLILRSVHGMKRGIGSIRQDVNISIKGGARTEIKGFQEFKLIPKVIEFEIQRQQELISKKQKVEPNVRKAEENGTTTYLRPLPGAARMYPETDIPLIVPEEVKVEKVELIEEKAARFEKIGIHKDLAKTLAKSDETEFVDFLIKEHKNINPAYIAELVLTAEAQIKKQFNVDVKIHRKTYNDLFAVLEKGLISKDSVLEILKENKPVAEIVDKYKLISDEDLEKELRRIIDQNKGMPFKALIGKAMEKLRGKADGKKIIEKLKKLSD